MRKHNQNTDKSAKLINAVKTSVRTNLVFQLDIVDWTFSLAGRPLA